MLLPNVSTKAWEGTNVVAVEAHQDDVELAAMGTLVLLARGGAAITVCSVTNGEKGSADEPLSPYSEVAKTRCDEAAASVGLIGGRFVCLDAEDEFLYDTRELRMALIDVFREARADIVLCPPPSDYQDDHTRAGALAAQAAHMSALPQLRSVHPALEIAPVVYYFDSVGGVDFEPDFWIDISRVIEDKRAAARKHSSQMSSQAAFVGWDLVQCIDALGRFRGLQSGVDYAEAFQQCRKHNRVRAWAEFPR